MLQAIKVGQRRIIINNIRDVHVEDYYSGNSGNPAGIEVTIYFIGDTDSLVFGDDEARDFLRQFDALTGIAETDAVAEPVAATETGTLRDALPFLREYVLEHFKNDLLCIIESDAPEAAKKEARALKAAINSEKRNRPRHSVYEMNSATED